MHATVRRYEGIDQNSKDELTAESGLVTGESVRSGR